MKNPSSEFASVRVLERGAWFLSIEHDDAVIDANIAAVEAAAQEVGWR